MDEKEVLIKQKTERVQEYRTESARTKEFPQIKEAVARVVQEYGETLKKLAKDD